jgi:hypothetical protein
MAQPGIARVLRARRIGALAVAVAALVALTSCGAGQVARTADQTPAIDGVTANIGPINLRAVAIVAPPNGSYPKGGDAPLQLVVVNMGMQSDTLTRLTSDVAASSSFYSSGTPASAAASPSGGTSGATTSSASSSGTASSPTSSGSATSSPSGAATLTGIQIAGGQMVRIGMSDTDKAIVLNGLTQQVFPAESFKMTFSFQNAGSQTFAVAVHLGSPPSNRPTEEIAPTAEA